MAKQGLHFSDKQVTDLKRKICEYLSSRPGGTLYGAMQHLNVSSTTVYTWRAQDPEFKEAIDRAREKADELGGDQAESKLEEAIGRGELTAILFYLKTKHKKRGYSERESEEKPKDDNVQVLTRLADVLSGFAVGKSTGSPA